MRTTGRIVYILQSANEMRHPYENSLSALELNISWFTSFLTLTNLHPSKDPAVIVIDLDALSQPYELPFQQLRTQFSNCDLIALSGSDSSQLALQCIRSGFTDFLLKPTSPEELAWSIRKCFQKSDVIQRLASTDSAATLIRAVTQISSCNTPALVQLYALEYLKKIFQAKGSAWLLLDKEGQESKEIVCSVPKNIPPAEFLELFPFGQLKPNTELPLVLNSRSTKERRVILACQDYPKGVVFLWGIKQRTSKELLSKATLLLEHSELTLLNIQKIDELKQQTFVDDLTGLYNSRFLKYAIGSAISRCRKPDQCFSVLFIDVDHFKSVNDGNGHLTGSAFLIAIGKTVKNAVRGIDPVFRYGGDEFVVILNDTNTDGAIEIAERIRKNIERRVFVIEQQRLRTTVSIGVATYPLHTSERDTLLKLADEAMYSAKRATRNATHLALNAEKAPLSASAK